MVENLKEILQKTASLARLQGDGESINKAIDSASKVIEYFNKLTELDTKNTDVTSHAISGESLLRKDEVKKFNESQEIIDLAPDKDGNFIQVPKVI